MTSSTVMRIRVFTIVLAGLLLLPGLLAQESEAGGAAKWDVTEARGTTRILDFQTEEGTWMSVDVSHDGRWVVFDLLGHVYRVSSSGGEAVCLTQDSGVAVNYHPRFSPDGETIAFISDRSGQDNLWLMEADGSNPTPVFEDQQTRISLPTWTPDGQYIVARLNKITSPGQTPASGIWMFHRSGGSGVELIDRQTSGATWPTVSRDGRYLYFQVSGNGNPNALTGRFQIRRFEFKTGETIDISTGVALGAASGRLSSGGAFAPEISPDGRWLAFARHFLDATIEFKGHSFGPRTALWLRDLETGSERLLVDPLAVAIESGSKSKRILPGYSWSSDGDSLVFSQGGKLHRVSVSSGQIQTVPFRARVRREISERAYRSFRISDQPFEATFLRWPTLSPDGSRLVFQAIGRIWAMEMPGGHPRRLTTDSFTPQEFAPVWSPDSRWIAFTSFEMPGAGHLWKISAGGGAPVQLTETVGEYFHPAWSSDGTELVVVRGSGSTFRGRTVTHNPSLDLIRVPARGGPAEFVITVAPPAGTSPSGGARRAILSPSWGPDGRIFFPRPVRAESGGSLKSELVSVRPDGSDLKRHLILPFADEIVPSPNGTHVAFQEGDNVYLVPFPFIGTGDEPVEINRRRSQLPVRVVSRDGGLYPRWRGEGSIEYGSAKRHYTYDVQTEETQTTEIHLSVPRRIPAGSVAITGARIVTLGGSGVLDNGSLIVQGSRIACVGNCDSQSADRTIDARGKTIIPGFVDMHAHHYREHRGYRPRRDYEAAIYLAYGVTTNLDNSMWSENIFPTAEMIEAGEMIGPRTFSSGDPVYRGDGPNQNDLTSYQEAEDNLQRLASWGAVSIKQYQQPRRAQRQWVSEAARKIGLMVTAEGGDLTYNLGMIMDGQTGWEHPMSYLPLYGDVAKFFGKSETAYSPTFVVAGPGPWNIEYFFGEDDLWKDPKQQRWLPWRMLTHLRRRELRPQTDYSYPLLAQGLADIIAEGGIGSIGSHGEHHALAAHWEVWMAASAMGNQGALEVASLHGARFLGAEQDLGSLEVGKLADFLILSSNPLEDIRNTLSIEHVVKGGIIYVGDTLDETWPESRPFGPYYWVDEDALRSDTKQIP